jgi:bacillithiol biosynthesis cysteine-adding enzyme BshC
MRANAFLPSGFGDAGDRRARVVEAASRRVSPELLATLREQNAALPPSTGRLAHLQALAEPGTAVVVTGQQVGLFLGPLYTLYKAASAIAIARALTAETGVRCVPLFWLQTEDHDFEEMATSISPLPDGGLLRQTLAPDLERVRCSIADRALGADVTTLLDQWESAFEKLPHVSEVTGLLRAHYRPGVSPGRAFAGVLAEFFAEDGLLVFDPRCPTAARLASPIIRKALTDAPQLDTILAERGRALAAAGFAEQIPPRPGSTLAFFHHAGPQSARHRLTLKDGRYGVPGQPEALSLAQLLDCLDTDPLRFSTSALLRPIVQDTLLPTAVYVGGPAEVSYFAQVSALYEAFDLQAPLIAERAHFRLMPTRLRSLLDELNLTTADLEQPREALRRKLAPPDSGPTPSLEWLRELEQRLGELAAHDPSLAKAVERTRGSVRHNVSRLVRRYEHAALAKDETLVQRLNRLESWLRPDGAPQERVLSFPAFAARAGLATLRNAIMAAVDPFRPALREIDL